jgi:excisionase family DNA binding protein
MRRNDPKSVPRHESVTTQTRPLDVQAVAQRLAVSPRTVRRLAEEQEMAHFRIGRRRMIRFAEEDVEAYLQRARVSAVQKR